MRNMKNLRILDLAYNPFTDISVLSELRKLEAVNLYEVSVENLEDFGRASFPEINCL